MLYYITTNDSKFREAQSYLQKFSIEIKRKTIDIPEIQAKESTEISKFSAEYTSKIIDHPFFVMDRSFHIEGLKGFPGPYVKYINKWFTEKNMSSLLSDLNTSSAWWHTSIAYCNNNVVRVFEGKIKGKIVKNPKGDTGWLLDKFFVPDTFKETLAELSNRTRDVLWIRCNSWKKFVEHLQIRENTTNN